MWWTNSLVQIITRCNSLQDLYFLIKMINLTIQDSMVLDRTLVSNSLFIQEICRIKESEWWVDHLQVISILVSSRVLETTTWCSNKLVAMIVEIREAASTHKTNSNPWEGSKALKVSTTRHNSQLIRFKDATVNLIHPNFKRRVKRTRVAKTIKSRRTVHRVCNHTVVSNDETIRRSLREATLTLLMAKVIMLNNSSDNNSNQQTTTWLGHLICSSKMLKIVPQIWFKLLLYRTNSCKVPRLDMLNRNNSWNQTMPHRRSSTTTHWVLHLMEVAAVLPVEKTRMN
jgi:hypothetical protein